MRAVVQRVLSASVYVDGEKISSIGKGVLVLVGFSKHDTEEDLKYIAKKIVNLRIFDDEKQKMNISVKDSLAEVLIVSQFTLYGDVRGSNRPSFDLACGYSRAKELYDIFCKEISALLGRDVKVGRFGAFMHVELVNYGPVTILIDSERNF